MSPFHLLCPWANPCLQPDEVEDPKLLDRRAKLRIAAQLGMDVARVNKFLHGFEEMCSTSVSL